jgi:murein DD-endopeptidase MepM/ murein hydrolase activator NlpD
VPTRSSSSAGTHLRKRSATTAGVSVLALAACAAAVPAATAAGGSGGGGAVYVAAPEIATVKCVSRCASRHRARSGSTIAILGSDFDNAAKVVFQGSPGRGDDVEVPVRPLTAGKIRAKVPLGATAGPVRVYVSRSVASNPSKPVPILPPPPPAPNAVLSQVPGVPALETGTSRTKVFYGARRAVTFSFRLASPMQATVELVRASDGAVVGSWDQGVVPLGEVRDLTWSGKAAPGRYSFRLTAQGQAGEVARSSQDGEAVVRDSFDLYDHVFPIRGRHDYGGAGGRFGAGRGGRSHQGQDVFAKCGTRLVAARGGKVQYSGYHGAAGNYIVIDGGGTSTDYAYMHLAEPSPFAEGDRVYTGQQIGAVGETGNARGCHLHFEIWEGPGWYEGGNAIDPFSYLQAWDGWS